MHDILESICESLDELTSVILRSSSDDRTLAELHGWQHPALTRQNIANIPSGLAAKIRLTDANDINNKILMELEDVPRRLALLQPTTVPQIFNGQAMTALPALTSTISWLAGILDPIFGWQTFTDNKAMPASLSRRLRGIQAEIDDLVPNKERLGEQIKQIQDATDAAESLPTDMQSLKEARKTIDQLSTGSAELYGKIDERHKNIIEAAKNIADRQQEANKLVEQCEEAYRITTTKGLAAAFDQRATQLGQSMWLWVVGLLCALAMGSYMGSHRVELLSTAIANKDPQWGIIWMHIALSALSVGAPLWFAWLATKQIGQRFKLAEDYGFKASVAKAYEGYKREAARIDEAFEARLFSSALTRLEEAPLRLIGNAEYGSPWHELISSDAFQKAISQVPELKDKFIEIAKTSISKVGNLSSKGAGASSSKEE
jgi:hypothetical protein